ncbi:MAG: TolC family protein [Bacteroidales bacterium]|nr:TolC family protein [Bacteroidales bacterium]
MKKVLLLLGLSLFVICENSYGQQDSLWSFNDCVEYALSRNIQVRKGELSNKRYGLYEEQSKANRLPYVSASLSQSFAWSKNALTGETALTGASGSNYSINSGVTLFNSSRITNLIRQAELDLKGGLYSLETTKESISLSILDAYLQVLYAGEQVKNSLKQIESTTSQLNLAQERLALKVISQADFAQVRSQLASEKLTLANSESQFAIAKVNLMQLMELPMGSGFNIEHPLILESVNENRLPDARLVYETSIAIKPQIKNAVVQKEIASIDEKIARAAFFPTLSAAAGLSSGYSTSYTDPYFDQLNQGIRPSIGFSLSIPIYQNKQAKTSVAVAKIGYMDAVLTETDTKNQLRKSIEQACVDVSSAQSEYEANLENYAAAAESASLSAEKFRQGIINSVDYMVSKTNLIMAESQLLQSKYNLIFSYKIMDFYMGIPLAL